MGSAAIHAAGAVLSMAALLFASALAQSPGPRSRRMPDARLWTIENLDVETASSFCYEDAATNCRRYGRLYTWDAATRACESLGDGWRLPTDGDWRGLAKRYGGVREDSKDEGRAAYRALTVGGSSGFGAALAGDRAPDGTFERLNAHGFYWTASTNGSNGAWFYNFGQGGLSLNRQRSGDQRMAASVRCVRE